MTFIIGLFTEIPFLIFPSGWSGWLGLLVWLGVIAALLRKWRAYNKPWNRARWQTLAGLAALTPFSSLLLGVRLPVWNQLPPPGIALEPVGLALMLFSALPWLLAAGLLGPLPAAGLAALSGGFLAYWDTHSIFTPLELATLAVFFSVFMMQRYRTRVYAGLRSPVLAAVVVALLYPLIYLPGAVLITQGSLSSRIDYAISLMPSMLIAVGGAVFIAGVLAELVRALRPRLWGGQPPWVPSPAESRLESRLIFSLTPLALILILTLMVGDWITAGNAAQRMLQERMDSASSLVAQGIPFFLSSGQNLILQFAEDERLNDPQASPQELRAALEQLIRSTPYFDQLFLLNENGTSLSGYPLPHYDSVYVPIEEKTGIDLALSGVTIQVYTIPPAEGDTSAQVSFIAAVGQSETPRVLIGRTDLSTNPFSKPILASLNSMADVGGEGYLLDENGHVLYHPDSTRLMMTYPLPDETDTAAFYEDTAADGTRQMVYYQPATGRPWSVVMTVPAESAQQLAIQIASPLLIMIVAVAILVVVVMQIGLRMVTSSLETLAEQADRISQGELDRPLPVNGDDEIARLSRAFEQMRLRLKARLQELNQLLEVSQGVASSLEMKEAVQPILKSALSMGGAAARVVLVPSAIPDFSASDSQPARFGYGPKASHYAFLDEQILALLQEQDEMYYSGARADAPLKLKPNARPPKAWIAIALRHENQYYGILWLAYDQPHNFSAEERRFIVTLAQQAALAAVNAHLFRTAEIGRQRLAAILASTPDPVLVSDHRDRLSLLNPAALTLFRGRAENAIGKPVSEIVDQPELAALMRVSETEEQSVEVTLENGRVYLATATSILAKDQPVGRVCVLRDVTHFKELDALKSEFVATVSHDLRSPLTLMRGYATMLEMVGNLNDQQEGYIQKIVIGVESMSRLVNNLLDLGRIEAEVGLRLEMLAAQDVIENVVDALRMQASQKQIEVEVSLPEDGLPLIEADQSLLTQAIHNLVENAIKYTPPEGKVRISVFLRDEQVVFEVRDTGIGISPIDQPRLFEKFYRSANREAKRQRGTGLGLAIVKSIAERHGGTVGVQSQLGEGSIFFISIPVRQSVDKKNMA